MRHPHSPLYIGTHRYVAAIEPGSGEELWRTKLPHSGSAVVSILIKGPHLFVGHAGRVYRLQKSTGQILWENGLPKMGHQPVVLAMEGAEGATAGFVEAAHAEQERHRAAAASS